MAKTKTAELRGLLAAFGATHQNNLNLLLHVLTFPYLVGSAAMLLGYLGPQLPLPAALVDLLPAAVAPYAVFTLSALVLGIYSAYYISFDPFAGLGWAACVAVPAWLAGEAARQHVSYAAAWAFALHVLGWCVQLAGHTVEGSKLAMHDANNTTGRRPIMRIILPIAPFYTWIVPMFMLGYRPGLYKGMLADINGAKKAA